VSDQAILLIIAGVLLLVLAFAVYKVVRALKTGKTNYGGNRPQLMPQTYEKENNPMGFWGGIIAFGFMGLICLISLFVVLLIALGVNV
jgi:ABC-type sugar transport system permease subunit